LVPKTIDIVTS